MARSRTKQTIPKANTFTLCFDPGDTGFILDGASRLAPIQAFLDSHPPSVSVEKRRAPRKVRDRTTPSAAKTNAKVATAAKRLAKKLARMPKRR